MKSQEITPREDRLGSIILVGTCVLFMFFVDAERTLNLFKRIILGIVAFFSSIWGLIVSIPLGVWLLLLILK